MPRALNGFRPYAPTSTSSWMANQWLKEWLAFDGAKEPLWRRRFAHWSSRSSVSSASSMDVDHELPGASGPPPAGMPVQISAAPISPTSVPSRDAALSPAKAGQQAASAARKAPESSTASSSGSAAADAAFADAWTSAKRATWKSDIFAEARAITANTRSIGGAAILYGDRLTAPWTSSCPHGRAELLRRPWTPRAPERRAASRRQLYSAGPASIYMARGRGARCRKAAAPAHGRRMAGLIMI